ncbi:MAG TPA: two-component regulator propeller domain-containing protein, partial [Burkholderiaceae bacterium]|nr:two-component regulator propeller domain-containing protein [Burkholderiaceae bacterium]
MASITDGVVSALAQDGRGFIWIGTTAGLVRFDGYQLRTYQLGNDSRKAPAGTSFVRSLLASQEGVLWIGTESDGLARFDPQTDRWTFFRSKPDDPQALAPGTVRALAQALDGTLWVGTIGGGLDRFDPASGQFTHFRQGAASGLPDDRIQTLFFDSHGDLWVGTWNGVARLRKGQSRFETLEVQGRPLGERIITLLSESPDGHLWVGTQQGDLLRLGKDSPQLQWIELGEQSGRRDTLYAMVAPDPQRLWLAR